MSLTGQPVDDILLSKVSNKVGTVLQSTLDEAQFNIDNPGVWKLMNGQSSVGSEYETITGQSNVPDIVTNGEFLRQAKAGRTVGSLEGDENKSHEHRMHQGMATGSGTASYLTITNVGNVSAYSSGGQNLGMDAQGASENRPKNMAVNHFIKIDY